VDALEKLNPSSSEYEARLRETVADLVVTIPESNRVALTHYIARRKIVLELFDRILKRELVIQGTSKRNIDETLLHDLIFQQSSKNPEQSDLWLINEDFVYFSGTSNVPLNQIEISNTLIFRETLSPEEQEFCSSLGEDRSLKRPDVLLFPSEGKAIIVEFKNPKVSVSDHLTQINKYASFLRNFTKDEFSFDTFYGFLIGEKIDTRDVRSADPDFKDAYKFKYMFRPSKTVAGEFGRSDGSIYMEIIRYSVLLERARERNRIFLDKLTAKSDVVNGE
jgi:hypothetical protein